MQDKNKQNLILMYANRLKLSVHNIAAAIVLTALCATVGFVAFPVSNEAQAAIPKIINFQGKLTAVSNGNNVANGTYAFEFKIYDAVTSGTLLWTETFDQPSGACGKLTVTNGVFNAKLGSCNALTSVDFTGGSLYLTVNFAPTGTSYDGEMSPRKQLVSSAFAFVANSVSGDGVVNNATQSTTALATGRTLANPALQVDTNTASSVTGLKVTSAAAAGGLALTTISSGTNENLTIDAKGSGTININGSATGDILLGGGSGSTGCTVTNSSGALACTAGGSFTTLGLSGAISGATGITSSGTITFSGLGGGGTQCVTADNTGVLGVAACGSALTPWTSDIDADGYDLNDLSNILFRETTGAPTGSDVAIFRDNSGDLNINTLTGKTTNIQVNGTDEYNFSSTTLNLNSNTITNSAGFNGLVVTANTGVITTGTWNGTAIGSQYGGTGQNFASSSGLPSINSGTWQANAITQNGVAYGGASNAMSFTAQGGANTVLVANAGAPSFSAAITVGTSVTSPTINATTALQFGGANINTAGTLTNVAYLNQANVFTADQTVTKADPSIVLNVTTATDTDFWLGVQDDAGGDDDDIFQIGDGTTPGTNPFLTINTSGNVGIGVTAPLSLLHVQQSADSTGTSNPIALNVNSVGAAGELTASSSVQVFSQIAPYINQTSTAGYTALLINATHNGTGSGTKNLIDFQVGGSSLARVDSTGKLFTPAVQGTSNLTITANPGNYVYIGDNADIVVQNRVAYLGNPGMYPNTPTQITSDQNDYSLPNDGKSWHRLSTDASRNITGFAPSYSTAQAGIFDLITNVGSFNIVLKHQDTGSTAANRLLNSTGADITLAPNESADIIYDATVSRWRVYKRADGAGSGGQTPWTSNIDADGYALQDALNIEFRTAAGSAPAGSVIAVFADNSGDLTANVLTGKTFNVAVNGTDEYNFSSTTLNLNSNTITNAASFNGLVVTANTGVVTTGTWQGTAVADTYVADTLTVDSSSSVHWNALNNYPAACSAGSAISQLADTTNTCTAFNTDTSITLQDAYNQGGTIETASNVPVIITETTASSSTNDLLQLTFNPGAPATASGDALQIVMDGGDSGSYTGNGIRIEIDQSQASGNAILIEDDAGTDLFVLDNNGALTLGAASSQTTAITITDTDYTNALSIADNNIIGTTAAIDFTNFDLNSSGAITTGTWNATAIGSQYGGTGQNWSGTSGLPSLNSGTWSANAITQNGVAYGGASNAMSFTAQGGANTVLVANAGAPSFSAAITVGTSVTSPTINATTALQFGGANINTAGTLTNVAYLNQANVFTADQTVTKADPSIVLNVTTATDTDFWLGVQDDAGGDDDDIFQIGDGTTPGTNPFLTINTTGQVGIGQVSPQARLHATLDNSSANQTLVTISSTGTYSGNASTGASYTGISATSAMSSAITGTGNLIGVNASPTSNSAITSSGQLNMYGMLAQPNFSGSTANGGQTLDLYGGIFSPVFGGTIGGASDNISLKAVQASTSSALGTTGNTIKYGVLAQVTGTADTNYGLYSSVSGATTNYGLYVASGSALISNLGGAGTKCLQTDNSGNISAAAAACGSALTPWTSDIDADGFDLQDLSNVEFRETTGAPAGSVVAIFRDNSGDLNINTLTGKTTNIQVNGTDEYNFSSTALAMNSNNITGLGTTLSATAGLTIGTTSANLALTTTTSGNITVAPASTGSVQITSGVTTGTGTSSGLSIANSVLSSGSALDITVTGTAGLTNQKGINVSLSGANGTGAQTTYGGYFSNTHTGTSINVGLYATASGGSSNYAAIFDAGNVGVGTISPTQKLAVHDGVILSAMTSSTPTGYAGYDNGALTDALAISGKYAYIGQAVDAGTCSGATVTGCEIKIFDITNPTSPVSIAGIDTGIHVSAMTIAGKYLYFVTDDDTTGSCSGATVTSCEVRIYDISNPYAPTAISGIDITTYAYSIYVSGKYMYVGNEALGGTCSGTTLTGCEWRIYDVSNAAVPVAVSGLEGGTSNFVAQHITSRYAFLSRGTNAGTCSGTTLTGCEFSIYDITDPTTPAAVSGVDLAVYMNSTDSIYVSGKYVYLTNNTIAGTCSGTTLTGCEIRIYDISNISSPAAVSGVDLGVGGYSVALSGKYLYVTAQSNGGNEVLFYDVSTPSTFTSVGGAETGSNTYTMKLSGKYLYATTNTIAGTCSGSTVTGCEFRVYDIAGYDSPAATIGSLYSENIRVATNIIAGNNIYANNGLNVGIGGILSGGPVAIQSATTGSTLFALDVKNSAGTSLLAVRDDGSIGMGTTGPGRALEINSATGTNLRLTYNDNDGSAANFVDLLTTSGGNLQVRPSGFVAEIGGGTTRTALRFLEPSGTGTDYAAIQSNANVTTSYTWTLPAADASGCIQSNGSGTLSISACGGGLTVGSTAIASGGANRILFENGSNVLSEDANFTYDGTTFTVAGNPSTGAQMALTNTGVYTGTGLFNLTANSATTGVLGLVTSSSLTSGSLLSLTSNGTGALTNQKGINVSLSGANGTGSQTTYGGYFSNTHGGSGTNIGLYATATTGTNNYAAIFDQGNVGIGDTSPLSLLTVGSGDLFQVASTGATTITSAQSATLGVTNTADSPGNYVATFTGSTGTNGTSGVLSTTKGFSQFIARSSTHTDRELRFQVFSDGVTYFGPATTSGTVDADLIIRTSADAGSNTGDITISPGGSALAYFMNGGVVGIGTSGADRKLDVLDASNPQLRLTTTDGTVYGDFQNTANANAIITGNTFTSSSAKQYGLQVAPTINQTSSASYTGLDVNVTETAATTLNGLNRIADFRVGGSSKVAITPSGTIQIQNGGNFISSYSSLGSFQNHLVRSQEFDNASWVKTNVTAPTANTQNGPDGSATAESLATSSSGGDVCQWSGTAAGSNTFTFSVWARSSSGTQNFDLRIDAGATSCATANNVTGTAVTHTATTSWQRFSVTQTFSSATGNVKTRIFPGGTGGTGTVYAWGAQLDQASTAGGYAFTTGGALTNTNRGETLLSNFATTSGFTYGGRHIVGLEGAISASSSTIGEFIRVIDNATGTDDTATVRGLEVQAFSGTNINGINTGIASFGYTFGVHAVSTGQANEAVQPAAVFADLDNGSAPTQGNAIRAYSNDLTSADLVSFYQETSAFTGNGLEMNFGVGAGSFTGNFISLQKAGTENFRVDDTGEVYLTTTATTSLNGLCHASTGAATADRVVDCSGTPSDIAEWYETKPDTQAAEIVSMTDEQFTYSEKDFNPFTGLPTGTTTQHSISILQKSLKAYDSKLFGVVSTSPNQVMGEAVRDKGAHPLPIALKGRVLVKVTNENGEIKAGDYITSSATVPGAGMKASRSGQVVGRAMNNFDAASGTVLVFMEVGFQSIGNAIVLDAPTIDGQNLQSGNEDLTSNAASTFVIQQQGAEGDETGGAVSDILQLQSGDSNRFMVSSTGATSILSNLTCTEEDEDTGAISCPSVLKVTQADTELMNIDAHGTLTLAGTIFIKDDSFAGSIATDENGLAEITFSYNLGTGKPVVQLTAEASIPVFAQIMEFKQDEHGNYTGFVMKTFDLISGPIQAIVHYNVTGKQEGYITLGEVLDEPQVPVFSGYSGDDGQVSGDYTGGDGAGLIIENGEVVGGDGNEDSDSIQTNDGSGEISNSDNSGLGGGI